MTEADPLPLRRLEHGLFWAGMALVAVGFLANDLFTGFDSFRLREAVAFTLGAPVLAWMVARAMRMDMARVLVAILLVLHVWMVGATPVLATVMLAGAAFALGDLLVPAGAGGRTSVALVVGLGLIAGVVGWLLPYGLHRAPLYALACALPIAARWGRLVPLLRDGISWWRHPRKFGAARTAAIMIVSYSATSTWLPTAQFDDLAYHLAMPWDLMTLGHYRFDVQTQVWAVAPWATDVLQAVAQVLARVEARGALNTLWLLVTLRLMWHLLSHFSVAEPWRWLAIALFASQPLLHTLLHSMHTELPMCAVLLAITLLVIELAPGGASAARIPALGALAGFALGMKLIALLYLAPLAIWTLVRMGRVPSGAIVRALALALLCGASSYAYALVLTGNPVLPLFNDWFGSPYFGLARQVDERYVDLATWRAPYDLVVNSARHYEGRDGAGGFQWLAGFGLLLVAAARRDTRALALAALAAVTLLYLQMQYLRYLLPGLGLLGVVLAVRCARMGGAAAMQTALWVLVALNVAAFGNAGWQLREGVFHWALEGKGDMGEAFLRTNAPERVFARHLRERHPRAHTVLMLEGGAPFVAELSGTGLANGWYDPTLDQRFRDAARDPSGERYRALMRDLGATHVVVRPEYQGRGLAAALAADGELVWQLGLAELYRIRRDGSSVPPPAEPGHWYTGRTSVSRTNPHAGPVSIDYEVLMRCQEPTGALSSRLYALSGIAAPMRDVDFDPCPLRRDVRLSGNARSRGAEAFRIDVEQGDPSLLEPFQILSVSIDVRPDFASARDLSARLRP